MGIQAFPVPGSGVTLQFERAAGGRLTGLRCGGRVHLCERDGVRVLGDGLARVRETPAPDGLLRWVTAAGRTWVERYRWDRDGRLAHVDGVDVRRDRRGRVVACEGAGPGWRYTYAGDGLAAVEGPHGVRRVTRGPDGRPLQVHEGGTVRTLPYRPDGVRADLAGPPPGWHRDPLGRLWTVTGPDGRVLATYLWDGYACLGRVDGPPDGPLAAVFSLDPTCTPVRVITAGGVRRLPRDAFGEGLLAEGAAHPGVPGLFGGAVHGQAVHLPFRPLDPRTGAFAAPDPFHGRAEDPRRRDGYRGPLPVEPDGGAYAACRGDPVGRADPTGAISVLLVLSDLTWSLQNNLLGWFGLDLTVNFWGSLFASLFTSDGQFGRFFDFEGVKSSSRLGSFGVRRDGVATDMAGGAPAWTYQHQMWAKGGTVEAETATRAILPKAPFTPALYGSVLRVAPDHGRPLLLRGDQAGGNVPGFPGPGLWTRAGGKAQPALPDSTVPVFPEGGLHLDDGRPTLPAPQDCTVAELVPVGRPVTGTVEDRAVLNLPGTPAGVASGTLVGVTDADEHLVITEVLAATPEGAGTRLRLRGALTGLDPGRVRLRGLGAALSQEPMTAGAAPEQLLTTGTAGAYTAGDVLRLRQGGAEVGAFLVSRLETQLELDAALPGGLAAPLTVALAAPTGTPAQATIGASDTELQFAAGQPAPGAGEAILVTGGGTTLAVMVTAAPAATTRTVDRGLGALGAAGAVVTWRRLTRGAELGQRGDPPETGTALTYQPSAVRTAPTGGFVQVEDAGGTTAVRAVAALVHDAVVLRHPLPAPASGSYDVERFGFQAPDERDLVVGTEQLLATDEPLGTAAPDAEALRQHQLSADDLATALAGATPAFTGRTVAGAVIPLPLAAGATPPSRPVPSQLVVLTRGAEPPEPAVVAKVRVAYRFDRDLGTAASGLGGGPLELTPLTGGGPAYAAVRLAGRTVTVRPEVTAAGRTQLPRFGPGETVEVAWTAPAGSPQRYAVDGVDGTTITLHTGKQDIPAGAADLTVRRLVPADPRTGGARVGVEGTRPAVAGAGAGDMEFSVWRADAPAVGDVVAVSDGSVARPAVLDSVLSWQLELAAAPARLTGAGVALVLPSTAQVTASQFAASFTARDRAVTLADPEPHPAPIASGSRAVVAVGFAPVAAAQPAKLSQGGVRVPEAGEDFEIGRRQSLIDHELRHTQQSALWGPLLLCWFPLFALEGLLEGTTDIELPEFSAAVQATVEEAPGARFLQIPDPGGIPFATGDHVRVSSASGVTSARLGEAVAPNRFRIDLSGLVVGPVSVRRETTVSNWLEWTNEVLQILTHGGVLNLVAGTVYGGIFWAIGKGGYALYRAIFGDGDTYPATVSDDGTAVVTTDDAGRAALRTAARITIQDKDADTTFVRPIVATADPARFRLGTPIALRGEVKVAPYSTHTPESNWDWHDYYPATVTDPARPFALQVHPVGDDTLRLDPHDRVTVTAGEFSIRSYVMASGPGGAVELRDPVLTDGGQEREVRIAKIGERDPMHWLDTWVVERLAMGWMRWAFDPYGQLQHRLDPAPGSFFDRLARIGRYMFGTQSWAFLPIWGWFIWDNALKRSKAWTSQMEQDASEQSGDLYSPVGRLRKRPVVVGDIGRYWYYEDDRDGSVVTPSRQDAPGVHLDLIPRLLPFVPDETGGRPPNNLDATPPPPDPPGAAPAGPGSGVADVFVDRDPGDPRVGTVTDPASFVASDRGWVPVTAATERASGIQVAFCRPGKHRVTIRNQPPTISGKPSSAQKAREAQDDTGFLGLAEGMQRIFFDVEVADVTVLAGGVQVDEGGTLTLVQTQRAALQVTPDGDRVYAVTTLRPAAGESLRTADDGRTLVARALSTPAGAPEPAEVSRRYRLRAGTDIYESGGLAGRSVHLGGDLHVPVRSFSVEVVDRLPVRSSAEVNPAAPTANAVTDRRPGEEVFVIVPAALCRPLQLLPPTHADGTPAPLNPVIGVEKVPDTLRPFVGDGGVFKVSFPAAEIPREPVPLRFEAHTWVPEPGRNCASTGVVTATLRAEVTLLP